MPSEFTVDPPETVFGDVLSIPEIADLFAVSKGTVEQWRVRSLADTSGDSPNLFPQPDDHFGGVPAWRLERLLQWGDGTGRDTFVRAWRTNREAGKYRRKFHPKKG
jgi:hypothetical protein